MMSAAAATSSIGSQIAIATMMRAEKKIATWGVARPGRTLEKISGRLASRTRDEDYNVASRADKVESSRPTTGKRLQAQ